MQVVSELTAPSNQRFALASSARMVGRSAERACGQATAALAEALKAEVPAPSLAVLQHLAARSVWPVNPARDPLHALVLALLHGPEPLAAHLEGSDWTEASLARAWREASALEVVLPLAAMGCSAAEMSLAVQVLLEAWQPAPELVSARALRALQQDRAAFGRAHAVYLIACRAPSEVSLTAVVRQGLPVGVAEELYGWLQLFAEASQAAAARSLKSLLR